MIKKLSKYDNNLAIIIDKPILELLNVNTNTKIKITTDGKKIILEPVTEEIDIISDDEKLQKIYEKMIKKYGPALKKLSKN